jgi:hypothetical protein
VKRSKGYLEAGACGRVCACASMLHVPPCAWRPQLMPTPMPCTTAVLHPVVQVPQMRNALSMLGICIRNLLCMRAPRVHAQDSRHEQLCNEQAARDFLAGYRLASL